MKTFIQSLVTFLLPAALFAQGDLPPPAGAPVASMKTLTQVESRTDVQKLALAPPYTISAGGSYYLTGNITVAAGNAINITAVDGGVTLDLNGYTIRSTHASGSGIAINIASTSNYATIYNGQILCGTTYNGTSFVTKGFASGIVCGSSTGHQVRHVTVAGIAGDGIALSFGNSTVSNCIVQDCSGDGIAANIVTDCGATSIGKTGISGSSISNCTASSRSTTSLAGILGGVVSNCSGSSTGGPGISGSAISGCFGTSSGNSADLVAKSYGIFSSVSISNSRGTSTNSWGLYVSNGSVSNSYGFASTTTGGGIFASANVSFSTGGCNGGTAIQAVNAVACTSVFGTVTATNKSLGTP